MIRQLNQKFTIRTLLTLKYPNNAAHTTSYDNVAAKIQSIEIKNSSSSSVSKIFISKDHHISSKTFQRSQTDTDGIIEKKRKGLGHQTFLYCQQKTLTAISTKINLR